LGFEKFMAELDDHIKRITTKLRQLLKNHEALQKELAQKSVQLHELNQTKQQQTKRIEELEQQVLILKSVGGDMNETDKKAFEKRINLYINEINKCIGLLSE
jgi:chromosome segregation ATPase